MIENQSGGRRVTSCGPHSRADIAALFLSDCFRGCRLAALLEAKGEQLAGSDLVDAKGGEQTNARAAG